MTDEQRKYTGMAIRSSEESRARQEEEMWGWLTLSCIDEDKQALLLEGRGNDISLVEKMIQSVRERYGKAFCLEHGYSEIMSSPLTIRWLAARKFALESLRA